MLNLYHTLSVCYISCKSEKSKLKDFKLSGIYRNLEERLSYAREKSLFYLDFLTLLLEDEQNNRRENSYRKRYSKAKLPAQKQIEDFYFSFQPSVDKRTINDRSPCQFITSRRNIVLIGNPCTGKTHLAIGIAMKALLKGYKVLFTPVARMLRSVVIQINGPSYRAKDLKMQGGEA